MGRISTNQASIYDDITGITSIASQYVRMNSDFVFGAGEFGINLGGTATTCVFTAVDPGNHPGIATLGTGSTNTGQVRLGFAATGSSAILLGFGEWKFECVIMIPVLSDGTERFAICNGFIDGVVPADGVSFRYIDNENSGRWQAATRSNNATINTIDTGITVNANQWYRQTIIINAAGTLATFFIDGVQVASTSTSIPTGTGRQLGVATSIAKTLGSTTRLYNVDLMDIVCKLTTPR
jgi:hypothetical protein